jgi:hypothetical protein
MTDDDVRVRLCVRVADAEQWTATAVVETCGRCRHPVFVDRVTSPDPPGLPAPLALVCIPCGEADPVIRAEIMKICRAMDALAGALPPAFQRKDRK